MGEAHSRTAAIRAAKRGPTMHRSAGEVICMSAFTLNSGKHSTGHDSS